MHNHVSQLGIHLISTTIHFHESWQSLEYFKRMHCPLSHCVSFLSSHAAKSFCHATRCSKEIWRSFTSAVYTVFVSVSLSQSYGYYIHIILELCSEFRVIDVGLIMALLRWDYSRRHQLIIREIVLETIFSTLRSVCLNDIFSISLEIGSHHWPLIDRIDWVFDIRTSIHTQYIVLGYLGNHWH